MNDLSVEFLHDPEGKEVQQVVDLVNAVYAVAEDGIWLPSTPRTSVAEIREAVSAREIIVARLDDRIVGSIRARVMDAGKAETGMLVADPDLRNKGIGKALRKFAISHFRSLGIHTLQIELLTPRDKKLESKAFMSEWNERDGYKIVRQGEFEADYPHLAPHLAAPCDYIIYEKNI